MACDKFRFRFRKGGDLRLVSHGDLMRCFERMLRRSALPFRSTSGFHPQPRLVLALSLPLGVVGSHEVAELETTEELEPTDVLSRLAAECPIGLSILSIARIPLKLTGRVRRVEYRLTLPEPLLVDLPARIADYLAESSIIIARQKPTPKRVDIRPYIRDIRLDGRDVVFDLWITQAGTARAEWLVASLGLQPAIEAGSLLERSLVEVLDELPPGTPPAPEPTAAPPSVAPRVTELTTTEPPATTAEWGVSPHGPVVE